MQGLPRVSSFFCNNFNKSAQMLHSNLSYGTTTLKSHILFKKKCLNLSLCMHLCYGSHYIEDNQFFGMNMPFISSSEGKKTYYMSGKATNEIFIFLLHEMK